MIIKQKNLLKPIMKFQYNKLILIIIKKKLIKLTREKMSLSYLSNKEIDFENDYYKNNVNHKTHFYYGFSLFTKKPSYVGRYTRLPHDVLNTNYDVINVRANMKSEMHHYRKLYKKNPTEEIKNHLDTLKKDYREMIQEAEMTNFYYISRTYKKSFEITK